MENNNTYLRGEAPGHRGPGEEAPGIRGSNIFVSALSIEKRITQVGTYGLASEADTLLRVQNGTLPHEGLDTTGTTVGLVKGHLANDRVAMLPIKIDQRG